METNDYLAQLMARADKRLGNETAPAAETKTEVKKETAAPVQEKKDDTITMLLKDLKTKEEAKDKAETIVMEIPKETAEEASFPEISAAEKKEHTGDTEAFTAASAKLNSDENKAEPEIKTEVPAPESEPVPDIKTEITPENKAEDNKNEASRLFDGIDKAEEKKDRRTRREEKRHIKESRKAHFDKSNGKVAGVFLSLLRLVFFLLLVVLVILVVLYFLQIIAGITIIDFDSLFNTALTTVKTKIGL